MFILFAFLIELIFYLSQLFQILSNCSLTVYVSYMAYLFYGYGYGLFNVINQYIHDYHSHGILVNPLVFMQLWCSSGSSHIGSTFFEYKAL